MQLSFDFEQAPQAHRVGGASTTPLDTARRMARTAKMHSVPEVSQRARPDFSAYPTSKQVAYAERIARMKRRAVPDACFKDRKLMSRWIDSNR